MVNVARVSFALAREWIPRGYKNLNELIEDKDKKDFEPNIKALHWVIFIYLISCYN